jgi:3',5'-cyclic AMP phosphodiesterase CpdA
MSLKALKEMWPQLKIPVYVTPGNHDVSISGDMSMFEKFYPGSRNYVIKHKDWNIINLNSTESRAAENTNIPEDTFNWLDLNIKNLDPQTPTIISTHYPLGAGLVRRPLNSDRLLRRFSKFNLAAVFNGHWHGYTQTLYNNAYITTGRCCSRYRSNYDGSRLKGWFVCRAENGQVSRRFVAAPEELL